MVVAAACYGLAEYMHVPTEEIHVEIDSGPQKVQHAGENVTYNL